MLDYLLQALLLGFTYGLGPCTVSCAPLILPLIMASAKDKKSGVILSLIFSAGRIVSYVFLGVVSGAIGRELSSILTNKAIGVFIIIFGIALFFNVQNRCLINTKRKINGPIMLFVSGIILGLGPCPPLLALLAIAIASKSAIIGGIMGIVFGLGTVISPILLIGFFAGWFSKHREFAQLTPYVGGAFLVLLGIAYIVSG